MSSRGVQISVSLLIGLVIGLLVGRWTAPSDSTQGQASLSETPEQRPDLGQVASMVSKAKKVLDSEDGEGLAAVGGIISNATISDIMNWSRAPEDVTRRIINEMSDEELITTITSVTKLTSEELTGYSDMRDYANRMIHIALSGTITDELGDDFGYDSPEVQFATGANKSTGPRDPQVRFEMNTRKIYAVIPNDERFGDRVMVHWYRIDQPENLLFDQYRVSPSDDYSYVWLKSSAGEWTPGEYRVQFFTADELLAPIASGTYHVVGD